MTVEAHSETEARVARFAAAPTLPSPLRWLPWAILLAVALGFVRCLGFGFVNWDDDLHVLGNPVVLGQGSAREGWLTPSLGYAIPVTLATYRLEYLLVGGAPWLYHATNLVLHLGVCGLVYLVGRRLGLGVVGASVAMLAFGLHPVVVEPVAWVSGRKDLLAAGLALAATLSFWTGSSARRLSLLALAVLLFALAAFSKPSVLALPLVWALSVRARSAGSRRPWIAVAAATLLAAAAAFLSWVGQRHAGALDAMPPVLVWLRQLHYALGYHLGLALLVQQPLAKHIPAEMPPAFDAAVDLFPVGVGLLLGLWLRRRGDDAAKVVRHGLVFAAVAYLPSSGLVPLVRYLADSYVYLPLAGLAWAIGAGAEQLGPHLRPAWGRVLAAATAVALGFACFALSAAWRDGISLWHSVYERYSDSPQVCLNLGNAYFEAGRVQSALDLYTGCTARFGPDHFAKNRAIALFVLGRRVEAAALFGALAARYPGDPVVRKYLGLLAPVSVGASVPSGPARSPSDRVSDP